MRIPNNNEQRLGTSDSHVKSLGITQETNSMTYINTNQWLVRTNLQPITTQPPVRVNSLARLPVVDSISVSTYASLIMPLVVHADLIANVDVLLWKRIPFKTFFTVTTLKIWKWSPISVERRKQSIVNCIMWTKDENTWKNKRIN